MMGTKGKKNTLAIVSVVGAFVLVFAVLYMTSRTPTTPLASGVTTEGAGGLQYPTVKTVSDSCATEPSYTYSVVDKFTTASLSATNQIKENGLYPVSSQLSPKANVPIEYWANSSTIFCPIEKDTVRCGNNALQLRCWQNSTIPTLSTYDDDLKATLTDNAINGATNVTMGANDGNNFELSYAVASKRASMPFGGCVAVEVPAGISSISLEGAGITTSASCPYKWTYSVTATSNTYSTFAVPDGWDASGLIDAKKVKMQLLSGSSNPAGGVYITWQAANWYVNNKGEIVKGIEKDQNQDTTKTFDSGMVQRFGII